MIRPGTQYGGGKTHSLEQAMPGIDKLFLVNAVVADELTQALIAYGMARRVGLKHVPTCRCSR
jgi:hypothetical protein